MSNLLSLLLVELAICSMYPAFCTAEVGGTKVEGAAFISIFCGEFQFFENGNPNLCSFTGVVPGQVSCLRLETTPC